MLKESIPIMLAGVQKFGISTSGANQTHKAAALWSIKQW